MRFFLDTEFIENGQTIDLISIALVSEGGRWIYFVNSDCDFSKANDWVKANVIPLLPERVNESDPFISPRRRMESRRWKTKAYMAAEILKFVQEETAEEALNLQPEFWADYASYDWVALCQIFGTMIDLPSVWPMFCNDFQQELRRKEKLLGAAIELPSLSEVLQHSAIEDAKHLGYCVRLLEDVCEF